MIAGDRGELGGTRVVGVERNDNPCWGRRPGIAPLLLVGYPLPSLFLGEAFMPHEEVDSIGVKVTHVTYGSSPRTGWREVRFALFRRHRLTAGVPLDRTARATTAELRGEAYTTDDPTWHLDVAAHATHFQSPDIMRAHAAFSSRLASVDAILGKEGLGKKIMALAAGAPRYAEPGPTRADLVAAVVG
jgi:hypothetical protein